MTASTWTCTVCGQTLGAWALTAPHSRHASAHGTSIIRCKGRPCRGSTPRVPGGHPEGLVPTGASPAPR